MSDYTDDLAAAENSLRRIVERIGKESFGDKWLTNFAATDKIKEWENSQKREGTTRGGIQEQRLIYFSDFGDLQQIIVDNWLLFEPVFGDKDQTTVYLKELRELRNPDAHHRELTQGEKSLITGIS